MTVHVNITVNRMPLMCVHYRLSVKIHRHCSEKYQKCASITSDDSMYYMHAGEWDCGRLKAYVHVRVSLC